jgi:hypothetical protein
MKIRKILLVLFVISTSFAVYRILNILEINKIVENLHDSSCEIIGDIPGPEDFHIFNEKYLITISDEKLKLFELKGYNVDNLPDGGIHLIDIESKRIIKLEIKDFPKNISFHPHGIYISNDELYIINHAYSRGGERVEVFKLEDIEDNFLVKKIIDLNLKNKPFLDSFVDTDNWWSSFEKLLPYFRRVEFAGGEPLMDPTHYKILDMLAPYGDQIEIKYATNLTMLGKSNRTIWEYWPKFKSVAVNVSIDGIGGSYEYVRGNASWTELVNNIRQIQTIPNVSRIVGAVAVQVSNVLILDKMIELFLDDLGIVFYTNMVNYPNVLSAQVLPGPLKNIAITRLLNVQDKLAGFKLVEKHPMLLDLTRGQITGVINYLSSNNQSEKWQECIEFNHKLDATRNQCFEKITPEFMPYV